MAKKILKLLSVIVAILLIFIAYRMWTLTPIASPYLQLERQEVLETITATGRIFGKNEVPLSFEISGIIDAINTAEGGTAKKGDILLTLDNRTQRNLIRQRETAYEKALTNLDKLSTIDLKQSEESLEQARLAYEAAVSNYEKILELYEAQGISRVELENSERQVRIAESNLILAEKNLEALEYLQKAAALTIDQEKGLLDDAIINLQKTYLRAPADGMVLELNAGLGEFVQPGQKVLSFVPQEPGPYIETQLDEEVIGRIKVGQEALVVSSIYPDDVFKAEVYQIAPLVDDQRGTINVRLRFKENPAPALPNNATVSLQIITGKLNDVLVLENSILRKNEVGAFVFVESQGKAQINYVNVKDLGNGLSLVIDGINETAKILASADIKEGQRVTLISP